MPAPDKRICKRIGIGKVACAFTNRHGESAREMEEMGRIVRAPRVVVTDAAEAFHEGRPDARRTVVLGFGVGPASAIRVVCIHTITSAELMLVLDLRRLVVAHLVGEVVWS